MADGKIRAAHTKSNKANTLYNTDSYVVTLAPNTDGTGFLSGHADGSIVRWYVADDQNSRPQGKVVVHGVPPYALGKGTSINYVDKQGVERGGVANCQQYHISLCCQLVTKGGGESKILKVLPT